MNHFSIGIDVGSRTTKAVVLQNGGVIAEMVRPTGWNPGTGSEELLKRIREKAGWGDDAQVSIYSTGYGRNAVPGVSRSITEITCHARGAVDVFPEVRTVIDIGGQDAKVVAVDPSGFAADFAMNDRCAAGTGRFLEFMALSMEESIENFARLGLNIATPAEISSTCTVFAESEMLSLIAGGADRGDVVMGLHLAIARRIAAMAAHVGIIPPILFTGGVALNPAMKEALETIINEDIIVPENPVIVGALGAALLCSENLERKL